MALVVWKYQNAYVDITKLPTRHFPLEAGPVLQLSQRPVEEAGIGTASRVWDCAFVLLHYLWAIRSSLRGQTVLEIGSGTGLGGLAALVAGADVIFTDLPDALPFTRQNAEYNLPRLREWEAATEGAKLGRAFFCPLSWGSDEDLEKILRDHRPSFVVGADVVFWPETFRGLSKTLETLWNFDASPRPSEQTASKNADEGEANGGRGQKQFLIAYRRRLPREDVFWRRVQRFADVRPIAKQNLHKEFQKGDINILTLKPK